MVCPKCGKKIEDGMLYCGYCGEEIRIVPDFNPEIEISIEETLNNVVREINEDLSDDSKEETAFAEVESSKLKLIYTSAIAMVVVILLTCLAVMIYHDNSASYQAKMGDKYLAKNRLNDACTYFGKAVGLKPTNFDYRNKLAECYIAMDDIDMAVESYRGMLNYDKESTLTFNKVIDLYMQYGEYEKINDFLIQNGDEQILEAFEEYVAIPPTFSIDEGNYDDSIVVAMSDISAGKIYYSIDGGEESIEDAEYVEPLYLKNGTYIITAYFVNAHNIKSSVVSKKYVIESQSAGEPVIMPLSGEYTTPQLIRIIVPNDCNVYYTFDGTDPDENSRIYCDPIALPEGESVFKFISVNSKGQKSDISTVNYTLNVPVALSIEDSHNLLISKLVEVGYILDENGSIKDYPGNFSYVYADMRLIGGVSLYCFNEYYDYASIAKNMTSNRFGVDVMTGDVYVVTRTENNVYSIKKL